MTRRSLANEPVTVKAEIILMHRDHHVTVADVQKALISKNPRGYAVDHDSTKFTIRRPYNSDPLGTWCVMIVEARSDWQRPEGE